MSAAAEEERDDYDPKIVEACAQAFNEVDRAFTAAINMPSRLPWERTPETFKKVIRSGVERVLSGKTPEELHRAWSAELREQGWVFGLMKDPEAKTHPYLVDYDDLPLERRRKDELFVATVRAVSKALGYELKLTIPETPILTTDSDAEIKVK